MDALLHQDAGMGRYTKVHARQRCCSGRRPYLAMPLAKL